jgi:hypothetical protein
MPSPVSCAQDKSQAIPTFDCQPVEITGDTTPQANMSRAPRDAEPDPSVQSLVKAATPTPTKLPPQSLSPVAVPPANIPAVEVAKAVLNCPSPMADVGLTALAAKSLGIVGAFVAGFKTGVDLANCLKPQLAELSAQLTMEAAEDTCRAEGGKPRAWNGNTLTCAVPEKTP